MCLYQPNEHITSPRKEHVKISNKAKFQNSGTPKKMIFEIYENKETNVWNCRSATQASSPSLIFFLIFQMLLILHAVGPLF